MTKTEFENLIAAYGTCPARWPEDRRENGMHYVQNNPEAADLMIEDAALDALLDTVKAPDPSELLRARIMKTASGHAVETPPAANNRRPWRAIAASLVAAVTIGIFGYTAIFSSPTDDPAEEVWLEAANDLGVSEIYAWVEGSNVQDSRKDTDDSP